MKYFKLDLLTRCRSLDDDVAEEAAEEWEQAITAYLKVRPTVSADQLFIGQRGQGISSRAVMPVATRWSSFPTIAR